MKYALIFLAVVMLLGCASSRSYRHADERYQSERDSLPPPMTIQDVADLAAAGVSDSTIIDQIRATRSSFDLSKDDIISLKKQGVDEKVIRAMIGRGSSRARSHYYYEGGYGPPLPWYGSWYYPYWWSPYSLNFGLFYRPFPHHNYFSSPPLRRGFSGSGRGYRSGGGRR